MTSLPDPNDIELLAFDLDGTLFGLDRQISPFTAATLAQVSELGRHVVIASGRSQTSIIPRTGRVPFIQWAVCSNGATLYDLSAETVAHTNPINEAHLADMIDQFERALPGVVWAWEDTERHHWTHGFVSTGVHHATSGVHVDDGTRPTANTLKVLIGHHDVRCLDLYETLAPVVPHNLSLSVSGTDFVEVTAAGVNKAAGLAELCRRIGVDSSNVAAFGDNINDLEMMEWVGHSVAMANARPQLLERSDYCTERTHDDDGVAHSLRRIFDLP